MRIRPARIDDLPVLQEIERAAGAMFDEIGMPEIADDEPPTLEALGRHRRTGLAWLAAGADDLPIGYLIAEVLDGALHVEQVSVHPDHARRGIGRTLLERAADEARAAGLPALTLTTFADVPWNAPYYERCGFRRLGPDELTPGLIELRRREAGSGLDRWPRVAMRRDL